MGLVPNGLAAIDVSDLERTDIRDEVEPDLMPHNGARPFGMETEAG